MKTRVLKIVLLHEKPVALRPKPDATHERLNV